MARPLHSKVSFNRQLSTAFVVGIVFLAIISSLLISWVASRTARDRFITEGLQITGNFAIQSRLALLYASKENAEVPVKSILSFPDVLQVAIFSMDGKTLLSEGETKDRLSDGWQKHLSEYAALIHESGRAWYFASIVYPSALPDEDESPFEEIEANPEPLGYVLVTMGKGSLHVMTQRIFLVNSFIALALASVLLLILRFITKRLTTPLENLAKTMLRAEQGETRIRAELTGPKDIVDMEHAFNKMMAVLEEREAELKEARDAALQSAQIKAEFAAVVSHEIRTPLNGVLGMLNLLKEIGVPERQREYLNIAINSGDTLQELINDILDFSKIEAHKLELEKVEFNLRENIEDTTALFAEKAYSKDIELCLSIRPHCPAVVIGDVTRLRQILNNLLSNAIKFTHRGSVELSVEYRQQENGHQPQQLYFAVKDTGIGIPEEAQERIFDSFRQADGSTTRQFGGTGLGLTISRQLIELMGGHLEVASTAGEGSTFSFSIPMEVASSSAPDTPLAKQHVLVMDRTPCSRLSIAQTLTALGCRCDSAETEQEALSMLGPHNAPPIQVCFFDEKSCASLPAAFAVKARTAASNPAMRLIMLTHPSITEHELHEIDATLYKPVRHSALKQSLLALPVETKPQLPDAETAAATRSSSRRILIVDDNRTNQMVAKAMLSESGYLADVASNGKEAVKFVSQKSYDLVLMDCNMPVMDGYDATKNIRQLPPGSARTPIFAMTAIDNSQDVQRCLDVGMDGCLIKPLNLQVLREKLNELFHKDTHILDAAPSAALISNIDVDIFSTLQRTMGDKIREIVDAFTDDGASYLAQLEQALDRQDWPQVTHLAHVLKGSARNLGANVFASIARELEDLARANKLTVPHANTLFLELKEEFAQLGEALGNMLAGNFNNVKNRISDKQESVLIVDDDKSTRLTIAEALRSDGLQIEHAANGEEGVSKFQQVKPDLVIMDAMMPIMNGFDACRKIRSLTEGQSTPILIITALENDETIECAFRSGAADFIPKPINLAVLRQRVKRVLAARQSEMRVKQLAYSDPLTGLPNRMAFAARLQQDLAYAKRNHNKLAVMFIDIDHFKDVNDNLGHAAGDYLLKMLAERVAGCVRSEDTLARLGGDEFVVVLSSVHSPNGANIAAGNILTALSRPFDIDGTEIFVGASIGISIYPDDGESKESLIKNADTAMYRAKANGRNNFQFYTSDMSASISKRVELETDIRKLIEGDELILYFQPQEDLQSGTIIGAEALIRWHHPTRGFLLPSAFIHVAEEAGLIDKIGLWVLRTACQQFYTWRTDKGFHGRVAVNVSARHFMAPKFVSQINDCLEWSGLEAEALELEITEHTILEHADETIAKLKQLDAMGITIAIDDFGVGFSSFNYLRRMPVQVLKIDASFVHDVPEDHASAAVVDGMIKLGHNLDLEVVAEGIENEAQYQFVQQKQCDAAQGYYISKPLTARDFYDQFIHEPVAETR
jgi:diguanylate cyclase (GGDEF)-like protein